MAEAEAGPLRVAAAVAVGLLPSLEAQEVAAGRVRVAAVAADQKTPQQALQWFAPLGT